MSTLADTASAFGGGVLAYAATHPFSGRNDPDVATFEKIFGYSVLGAFGASAIYGMYVTVRCRSAGQSPDAREARASERVRLAPQPSQAGFPDSVLEFQFGSSPAQAQRACTTGGRVFAATEGYSFCRPPAASLARPDVRFEFRFGQLSQIALLYPSTIEQLRPTFERVFGQATSYYGSPRVGPAPWGADCSGASTAQCLQGGEKPGRAVWTWSVGEVEIVPTLVEPNAYVELRYTRYDRSSE